MPADFQAAAKAVEEANDSLELFLEGEEPLTREEVLEAQNLVQKVFETINLIANASDIDLGENFGDLEEKADRILDAAYNADVDSAAA